MPRIRKKTSNRASTNDRAKVRHKVRETRKKKAKAAKKNPQWKSRKPKDPGIPNQFPYKDQILAEIAEQRRIEAEEKEQRKLEKQHALKKARTTPHGEVVEDGSEGDTDQSSSTLKEFRAHDEGRVDPHLPAAHTVSRANTQNPMLIYDDGEVEDEDIDDLDVDCEEGEGEEGSDRSEDAENADEDSKIELPRLSRKQKRKRGSGRPAESPPAKKITSSAMSPKSDHRKLGVATKSLMKIAQQKKKPVKPVQTSDRAAMKSLSKPSPTVAAIPVHKASEKKDTIANVTTVKTKSKGHHSALAGKSKDKSEPEVYDFGKFF